MSPAALPSGLPNAIAAWFSAPFLVRLEPSLASVPTVTNSRESPLTRLTFAALTLAGVLGLCAVGTRAMAREGTLKVGDSAPPLAVSTWLHGAEVKGFEPGHLYVVEFWATWCGPCIQIMPHMGDLQDEYREKGVTFIGFASEANDKEANVNAYVAKHGAKLGYTFAFGSGSETHNAYMKASGQNGIPCSFVVDKRGKIAYIGHPFFLDFVLPRVLDGTWDHKSAAATIAAADKDFDAAYAFIMSKTNSPEASLESLARFAAKWPLFANNAYMNQPKLVLLVRTKQFPEAKALAEKLIATAVTRGDSSGLRLVSTALRDDSAKGHSELTALAIKAVEGCYELDREDPATLLNLLEVYAFAGDQSKVKELGPKAVAAAKAAVKGENDAIGTLSVAAAYFASGDKEQARSTAEKAIKMVNGTNAGLRRYVEEQAKKYGTRP
jgi:thiol-disulfide isomerase/thioredoxin